MSQIFNRWNKFIAESRGFGEGEPAPGKWSAKEVYIAEEDAEQLDLPGMGPPESCEPADDVENLSAQLAQMVADSEVANEELDNLMGQIYDKIADLKGIGVATEEDPEDYRRTTMGFMDEAKDERISRKIAYLVDKEGKPRDQAVAIAHSMEERGELEEGAQ